MEKLLTPKDVAEILNIKIGTLYAHLSRGTPLPPYIRVGSQTRWEEADLKAWIKAKKRRNFEE